MTINEFAQKYDIPYHIVYESSYRVPSHSTFLHDRDFPEEGLRKAILAMADSRIEKHKRVLEQQIRIRKKVALPEDPSPV